MKFKVDEVIPVKYKEYIISDSQVRVKSEQENIIFKIF